jgi:hypothetical protein
VTTLRQEEVKREVADCTMSLAKAIQEAGGAISPDNRDLLQMRLGDFITQIAAQNGIRFIHYPKEG